MSQFCLSSVVNGAQALLMLDSRCPFWVNVSLCGSGCCPSKWHVPCTFTLFTAFLFPDSWRIQWDAFALVTVHLESLVSSAVTACVQLDWAAASSALIALKLVSLFSIVTSIFIWFLLLYFIWFIWFILFYSKIDVFF